MEDCTQTITQKKSSLITISETAQGCLLSSTDTEAVRSANTAPTSSPTYPSKNTQIFEQEYEKDKNNLKGVITRVLSKTDDQLKLVGASDTGTTCCLAFVRKLANNKQCVVANLGDTRAVLSLEGTAKRVTVDHKPTTPSEIERIK